MECFVSEVGSKGRQLYEAVGLWFFFVKQKTAYEMRISDWSSDVCSSDLSPGKLRIGITAEQPATAWLQRSRKRHCGGRRSEERRVGKECVSTCRSRWSQSH